MCFEDWTRAARRPLLLASSLSTAVVPVVVMAVLVAAHPDIPARRLPPANAVIPFSMKDAVVATEDRRFYSHVGIDLRGVLRAFWANLTHGEVLQGGSTITQQYVKQFMAQERRTLLTKFREALLAIRVEQQLSKDDILRRYLSTVYFGAGAYGIRAAAETYFRKAPAELTVPQAALLAGIIQSPTALNPRSDPCGAELRRRLVLKLMHEQNRIGDREYREALNKPVVLAADGDDPRMRATLVYVSA